MLIDSALKNPFPGLRSFEEDEDYLFFGREKQIDELLKKLSASRFLTVVGASGSGKSSLVKSGLLPSLYSGFITSAGSSWKIAVFRPGNDPIKNLAVSLGKLDVLNNDPELESSFPAIVETTLRRSGNGLSEAVKQSHLAPHENLLIVVDQFEEIFRFNNNEKNKQASNRDSHAFINLLLNAAKQKEFPVYIVLTMRSDFLGDCTEFRGLPEAINEGQYLIPRMSREERRVAIVGPIAVGGAEITPRLLTRLLNDVGDNPDQLPILQHALMRTWDHWAQSPDNQKPIDLIHYEAIGGMSEALSRHAEEAFSQAKSDRGKLLCEKLFKAITDKGTDSRGIRRPAKLSEIGVLAGAEPDELIEIIEIFRTSGRSFLMPPVGNELTGDSIIDISHESLMRVWKRLIHWVEEETQSAEVYLRLAEAAALYQEGKAGLWRDPELQIALKWKQENTPNVVWAQRYDPSFERAMAYLNYSQKQHDFEIEQSEKKRKKELVRVKVFSMVLGVAFLISLVFLLVALNLKIKAEKSEIFALKNETIANEERIKADLQKNEALVQKKNAEEQKNLAVEHEKFALEQKQIAELQKKEAISQKQVAVAAKLVALSAKEEADAQKLVAINQKTLADESRKKAEASEQNTRKLRMLALSRTLAIQAVKENQAEITNMGALLAYQSYLFNKNFGGSEFNAGIYDALVSATPEQTVFRGHTESVRVLFIDKEKNKLISGSDDGTIRLWDNGNPALKPVTFNIKSNGYNNIRSLGMTSNFIYAGTLEGIIYKISLKEKVDPVGYKMHAKGVSGISIDKKRNNLISTGNDRTIKVISLADELFKPSLIDSLDSRIMASDISPDGALFVCGTENGAVTIYNLADNSKIKVINENNRGIKSIKFSENGKYLACGTVSGIVYIYNLKNNYSSQKLLGHVSGINHVVFSNDSKHLATAGSDGKVRIWNMSNPSAEPLLLNAHDTWVWSLAFSPDDNTIFTGSADKTIKSWILNTEQLAGNICKNLKRNFTTDEWGKYVGEDIEYMKTCNELP